MKKKPSKLLLQTFLQVPTNEVSMQTCFRVFCCCGVVVVVAVVVAVVVDLNESGFISRESPTKRERVRLCV